MPKMTLGSRLAAGYVAAIAALLLVVCTTLASFHLARAQTSAVHDSHIPSIDAATRLLVQLERMENAEFMYFVPGQPREPWLARFDEAARAFDAAFVAAEEVTHAPEERALYATLGRHYGAFLHVDARMRRLLAAGRLQEARVLNATESLEAASVMREAARRYYDFNLAESARTRKAAERALADTAAVALLLGAAGVLAAAWLWWRTTRAIVGPVRALRDATREVAAGRHVRVRHPASAGTLELADLEAAFEGMAADLLDGNQRLERQVAERTAELREANARLEGLIGELRSLDRLKSNLLAVVSHELLTPLNVVIGHADVLADELAGPLTPAQAASVAEVTAASMRLTRMVRNVLLYARLESGEVAVAGTACEPNEAIAGAAARAGELAEGRGVRVSLRAPAELPAAWADPERLAQVLDELVDNAVKFVPPGGHVWLEATAADAEIVFEVRDDGPGLPAAAIERIFQPFHQEDLTSTREHGGLGLGLAVAYLLVARMGGMLMAGGRPGGGASFRFSLPRAGRAEARAPHRFAAGA